MPLNIKRVMKERNVTLTMLSRRMNIAVSTTHQFVNNDNPTISTLTSIAKALHCNLADLFDTPDPWFIPIDKDPNL